MVDESFVPANQRTNVLYCRLSDFCMYVQLKSAASCLFAVRDINGSFRFRGSYSHRPPARARGGYFAADEPRASLTTRCAARRAPPPPPLTTVSWLWHGARAADTSLQPNHAPHRAVGRRRLQPLAGCAAARRRRACWTPTMLPRELEF